MIFQNEHSAWQYKGTDSQAAEWVGPYVSFTADQLLLFLATVLSLVSGVQYFIMNKNLIFKKEEVLE